MSSPDIVCITCQAPVTLETRKSLDTGMYENYWVCEEHGKTEPCKPFVAFDRIFADTSFARIIWEDPSWGIPGGLSSLDKDGKSHMSKAAKPPTSGAALRAMDRATMPLSAHDLQKAWNNAKDDANRTDHLMDAIRHMVMPISKNKLKDSKK